MVQKFVNNLIGQRKFLSIEVRLHEETKEYQVIEVEKKDNSLSILSSQTFSGFENLITGIPKNLPTLLSFTGNGIISKKVENTANYRTKLLFNANADEFYWYELPQSGEVYASVIRKSIIDSELEEFLKHQIFIVDLSIGPLIVSALKPLLPAASSLYTKNFKLDFTKEKLTGLEKNQNIDKSAFYEIDQERISLNDAIPFANLLNYIFPNPSIESENEFLESNRQEFKFRRAFNTIGIIALPTFLLALLVSYLLLGYYQQEYIELQVELEEESIAYNKLVLLENDRDNKEAMLKESGLNDSNFLSFYISEITKEVPVEINLDELEVFSPISKIKPGQRIGFSNDTIEILGETSSNDAFADWIKVIKIYPWIENLEIVDFRKQGSTSSFLIRLKLKFNV